MFHINSISVADGSSSTIFGGAGDDLAFRPLGTRLGYGGAYIVAISGMGAIFLEDSISPDPSKWAVRINNSNSYLYYGGEGQFSLSVDANGLATITGDITTIAVPLLMDMVDMNTLFPLIYTMALQSPTLQSSWQKEGILALYSIGYPESSMLNMDKNCCDQFVALVKSFQFPETISSDVAAIAREALRNRTGLPQNITASTSWRCWFCLASWVVLATVLVAAAVAFLVFTGVGAALIAALETASATIQIAVAMGLAATTVASVVAGVANPLTISLNDVVQGLCGEAGYC